MYNKNIFKSQSSKQLMQKISTNLKKDYETLVRLGISNIKNNNFAEAIKDLKKAINIDNKAPLAHINLANLHIINKNLDLSQEILFEYIQKFGFNEEVANHLGKICFKYKKFINLEKLITLSKLNTNKVEKEKYFIFFLKGRRHEILDETTKAIIAYKKSIDCNKRYEQTYNYLLNLLEKTNDFLTLKKYIDIGIKNTKEENKIHNFLFYKSLLLNRLNKFEESEKIINNEKLENHFYHNNFFYLKLLDIRAKNNEKLKNFKIAFNNIEKRNKLLQSLDENKIYNKEVIYETIKKYKNFYKFENFNKTPSINQKKNHQIVFLVGFPRSGTTLLDTILRTHSKISVLEEKPYLLESRHEFFKKNDNKLDSLLNISPNQINNIRESYFHKINIKEYSLDSTIIDKLPLSMIELGFIKTIFPESKIILALRHPCDVVISCYFSYFKINEAMINFLDWNDTINFYNKTFDLFEFYETELKINYYKIKYEEIVFDFKNQVEKLLIFLDLKYEKSLENYYNTAKKREKISTPSYSQVVQPLYTSSIDRWKNYKQIINPEDKLKKWISKFNY